MSSQEKPSQARSSNLGSKRSSEVATGGVAAPLARDMLDDRLRRHKYRELLHKHLGRILGTLFTELTNLRFHIVWIVDSPSGWHVRTPLQDCAACCTRLDSRRSKECPNCGKRNLAATLESPRGRCFTCRLGVRNYWFPVRVRNEPLGIAYLQAFARPPQRDRSRNTPTWSPGCRPEQLRAAVADQPRFAHAARLLRLIVEHVQTATLSELRKDDLTHAGRAIIAMEREQARLHETLDRHLPAVPQVPRSCPESHAEHVVRVLLERIESDYAKPITLRQLAQDLGMNGSYLSALFSRTLGIPFKAYLTELRLQKAKELLANSSHTASDVAFAVGYSSEDRFRIAFKHATGLCPRAWRDTMQTSPKWSSSEPSHVQTRGEWKGLPSDGN